MTTGEHAKALLESLTCQNCLGSGIHVAYRIAKPPCPTCDGLGVVLPDEMVEAAVKAAFAAEWEIGERWVPIAKARAALIAGLREVAE